MSEVKVTTISNVGGTKSIPSETVIAGSAKAWVNFDGTTNTGGLCTIRDDFNVSSITDNGTGDYSANFDTAMSNANYCAVANTGGTNDACMVNYSYSTSSVRVRSIQFGVALYDNIYVNIVVFGN